MMRLIFILRYEENPYTLQLPDKELDIQLNVFKNHCEWQIKELGSLEQSKICNP